MIYKILIIFIITIITIITIIITPIIYAERKSKFIFINYSLINKGVSIKIIDKLKLIICFFKKMIKFYDTKEY